MKKIVLGLSLLLSVNVYANESLLEEIDSMCERTSRIVSLRLEQLNINVSVEEVISQHMEFTDGLGDDSISRVVIDSLLMRVLRIHNNKEFVHKDKLSKQLHKACSELYVSDMTYKGLL